MKRLLAVGVATAAILALPSAAAAQSGHFVGTQTCTDIGTQAQCSGKVAGLGGTTFTVTMSANGTASVECHNPAGNVAPGQSFSFTAPARRARSPRQGTARRTTR